MKSRSPLIQGIVVLLLVLLIAAFWFHRFSTAEEAGRKGSETGSGKTSPASPDVRDSDAGRTPERPAPSTAPVPGPETGNLPPVNRVEIHGILADVKGTPVPLIPVDVFIHDAARTLTRRSVESDAAGAFQVECPEFSQVTFTAHLRGHGRAFYPLQVGDATHAPTRITLSFRQGIEFDGAIDLSDGTPAAGARLRFHPMSAKSLDAKGAPLALNLINPATPPDAAWDERCRRELFLTDCELTCDALGQFRAHSLMSSTIYAVEVLREGKPGATVDCFTRDLNGRMRLKLPP